MEGAKRLLILWMHGELTGFGTAGLFPNPVSSPRDPVSTDRISPTGQPFQVFQGWNNNLTDDNFLYLGAGNWVLVATAVGSLTQLTGDTGTASPVAGSILIAGGTNLTSVATGATVTTNLNANITLEEINANFLFASGTDLIFTQSPVMQTAATTGGIPTGDTGDIRRHEWQLQFINKVASEQRAFSPIQ